MTNMALKQALIEKLRVVIIPMTDMVQKQVAIVKLQVDTMSTINTDVKQEVIKLTQMV